MTIFFPQRRFMDQQWPREVITRLLPYSIFAAEERDGTIASLKADLATANGELDKWRNLFQSGESVLPENSTSDPRLILDHIKSLQASQARVKDQLASSRRKETAMLIHLSNKEQEIAEMKANCRSRFEAFVEASNASVSSSFAGSCYTCRIYTYEELFRYVRDLNEETERMQQMVRILQNQVEQKDWQTV
ncbi:hypothetical protein SELMODRAFT_424143 [Selaginella moellendorffii]|uniref:Uncharacterized protein n=1 Tax=Selaginella moellendorffii TaxID=88036 RepID=D8SNY7_SELML|nr:hypothetical protein SELMODRAFT_424143 [Selaginella moellendorffii]